MYYIARSSTAETGTFYPITHVVPATTAGSTALYAWIGANEGNEVVEAAKDTPRRISVAVSEGDFYNTANNSVHVAITVADTAATTRAEIRQLLSEAWLAANFNGFTATQITRAENYARRLIAAAGLTGNDAVARLDRIKAVANKVDFEDVCLLFSTAWDARLAAGDSTRAVYPWPNIASNAAAGSVGLTTPHSASQVARPTTAQQTAVNLRAYLRGI